MSMIIRSKFGCYGEELLKRNESKTSPGDVKITKVATASLPKQSPVAETLKPIPLQVFLDQKVEQQEPYLEILHVNTNEDYRREGTLSKLENAPIKKGNTYVGISGLFNIKLACARKLENMIVFDVSKKVKKLWDIMVGECRENSTTKQIEERIKKELDPTLTSIDLTEKELNYFKDLVKNNQFSFLSMDLDHPEKFEQLSKALDERKLKVDTVYFSNATTSPYSEEKNWKDSLSHLDPKNQDFIFIHNIEQTFTITNTETIKDLKAE